MRSRSRWRFDAIAIAFAFAFGSVIGAVACGREGAADSRPVGKVGDLVLDERVVQMIATRDGIDEATARARGIDTLRLVLARRQALADAPGEPMPELAPERVAHLSRAALARLWLATDFEPRHRADDIPADDPLLQRARATGAWIHPAITRVCQVLVVPPEHDPTLARDPAWLARAQAIMNDVQRRIVRHVAADSSQACTLVARHVGLMDPKPTASHIVRFESETGYDLDACARAAADGTCAEPTLDREWTAAVRGHAGPAFLDPFATRFGVHLVLVVAAEPARTLADPDTDAFLREQILVRWQAERFARYVDDLLARRAVRIATDEDAP